MTRRGVLCVVVVLLGLSNAQQMGENNIQAALAPQFGAGLPMAGAQQFGPDPMVLQQQQQMLQMAAQQPQQPQQPMFAPQMNLQTGTQFMGNPTVLGAAGAGIGVGSALYAPYMNPWASWALPKYMPPPPGPAPYPFPSFNPPNYYNPSNQFVG